MFDKNVLSTLLVFSGVLLAVYLLRPLIPGLCLALVLIYVTSPMTNFLQKYVKKRVLSTSLAFLVIALVFGFLSFLLVGEIAREASRLPAYLQDQNLLQDLGILEKISWSEIVKNLLTENGLKLVVGIASQVGNLLIQVFFGVLISFAVVWQQVKIPVTDTKLKEVLSIIDRGLHSVISSLFSTAVVTGLISVPIYIGFGLPYPLMLALLTGFLTLLPVIGAWLLYLPVTGYLFFEDGVTRSLVFLVVCAVFISTLPDILVRPITGKTKEVGAIPLLVGFISGMLVFGVSGIVLGPVIIISAIAFWKVYYAQEKGEVSS
ncbi:MAG: AI-2E family transporter [Theionarchaea archaeon]|nr:AI-2E family transporter [Theionarchaea archaeon]MBU7022085.1 AI-2E family transporter [Theionarchaea archaeon]MBU7035942.1 AI-2E family transporter [Theionarchaea archaeon]MBU7040445.1 AI-2E family transporter [Theionarchaea archaeon]